MNKNWKNEAVSLELHDIVRYNTGYLGIFRFQGKGSTWYASLPVERSAIDASLKGQNLLNKLK